jgi:hypothetical protein
VRRAPTIMSAVALVLAAGSLFVSMLLFDRLRDEGAQRRNQTCVIFERKQKKDVDQLRDTYHYLAQLSPREYAEAKAGRGELLNRAVIANLPKTVADAKEDDAPEFCDAPGVGLPEPDPVLPKRPRRLR